MTTNESTAVQDRYAPASQCFGCGPANDQGLRIKSVPTGGAGNELACTWHPLPHHQAFPGMLNGGIIGALLDCHSNWTAAHHLMQVRGLDAPPCTVTAEFTVKLKRPTPLESQLHLRAHVVDSEGDRVVIEATLTAEGKLCATCHGVFVAVKEGHPAFHRW